MLNLCLPLASYRFFRALFTFIRNKVVKGDSLGADKAFFEVGHGYTAPAARLRQRNGPMPRTSFTPAISRSGGSAGDNLRE